MKEVDRSDGANSEKLLNAADRWSPEAILGIEFENNGILDSLTGSDAPSIFMQNLKRVVSRANRNPEPITILTVKYSQTGIGKRSLPGETLLLKVRSEMEQELLSGSRAISHDLRGGDFFSRMAVDGFWICLHSDILGAQLAADRFRLQIANEITAAIPSLEIALYQRSELSSLSSLVAQIDSGYFRAQGS